MGVRLGTWDGDVVVVLDTLGGVGVGGGLDSRGPTALLLIRSEGTFCCLRAPSLLLFSGRETRERRGSGAEGGFSSSDASLMDCDCSLVLYICETFRFRSMLEIAFDDVIVVCAPRDLSRLPWRVCDLLD